MMDKMKNILGKFVKAHMKWVLTAGTLVMVMAGIFIGYMVYVRAVDGFIFTIAEHTPFSDTAKVNAKVKVASYSGFPDDYIYDLNLYSWHALDDNNYPVFNIVDVSTNPGVAVLEEIGAGTSRIKASYYDSYSSSDSQLHELSVDSQNTLTITVPLRMEGYVSGATLTSDNNVFTNAADAFYIWYNGYTRRDDVTGELLADYHTVDFLYNENVVMASAPLLNADRSSVHFDTLGGGSSNIWATVDGITYKLPYNIYVGVKTTTKGNEGITLSQDKMVALSDGYTNILTPNFGAVNEDGSSSVFFWTNEDYKRSLDNTASLIDVVEVSGAGVITGKYAGTTTVYASCRPMSESYNADGSLNEQLAAAIKVTVPFEKLFEDNIVVSVGDNIPILTTAFDDAVTYSYEYNNEGAITQLDEATKGMYVAVKEGTAKVKVVIEEIADGATTGNSMSVIVNITVIDKLTLSKASDTVNVGYTTDITAIPTSTDTTDGKVSDITWKSSDENIATVTWDSSSFESSLNATITGISKGTATIYAYQTVGGVVKVASMTITVTIPVDGITLSEPKEGKQYLTMYLGQTLTIYADLQYSGNNVPDNTELVWTVSGDGSNQSLISLNPTITTGVHQACEVRADSVGATTLTVYCKDSSHVVNCDIVVTEKPTSIELSETSVLAAMSQKQHQLKAIVHSANNGADQTVIWSSLDTSVCTVDPDTGLVTLVAPGSTYICATSAVDSSITAYCYFEVKQDVKGIILDTTSLTMKVGDTYRLTATVSPADAFDKTMVWTSSNPEVVAVEDSTTYENLLTAVSSGSATIFAETTDGGYIAYCNVRVLQPVTGITISNNEMTVRKGTVFYLNATVIPDTADDKTIVWSTNDETIATVSADGMVSTLSVGQCIITATNPDSEVSVSCTVNVLEPVTGITLNTYFQNMVKGTHFVLVPTVEPITASNKNVTFWSSDSDIATVDEDGVVTAVSGGVCEIVVTTEESALTATCVIVVKEYVTSITLSDEFRYLNLGDGFVISAAVETATATDKNVIWSSSNTAVATVNDKGYVSGVGYGTAVITATAADGSGVSASCIVKVIKPVSSITLDKSKVTMYVGDVIHITATVNPPDATVQKLSWTSSDPSIAKVYDDGDVEAVSVGRCKVYATSTDGNNVVAECTIIVKQIVSASSLTINSHEITMLTNKMRTLTARLYPVNSTETVHWLSTDTSVLVVDGNGQITTIGPGTCEVVAYTTYGTVEDRCTVHVMAMSRTSITLEQYDTFNLYVDGAPDAVSWRSSNPRIATVTQSGIVTARMPGECTITATVDGKTVTCSIKVMSIDPGKFINPTNQ